MKKSQDGIPRPWTKPQKEKKNFAVTLAWGSPATREELGPEAHCEYSFDTEAELRAFMLGVDEAAGWMDYEIVEG